MKVHQLPIACLLLFAPIAACAYGGGGGSQSCAEPKFFNPSPPDNASVDALQDFSFVASDTDPASLGVKINGSPATVSTTPLANGDLTATVHLATPVTAPGRVQIAVDARSKDGCAGFQAYYVLVK